MTVGCIEKAAIDNSLYGITFVCLALLRTKRWLSIDRDV